MNILTLAAVMQASVVAFELQPYQDAYRNVIDSQRPFLVIIGADWCHACQHLKQNAVPQVGDEGGFRGVEVAYVDIDRDAITANQLMKGTRLPQVVRFQHDGKKWSFERLTEAPTHQALTNFAQGQKRPAPMLLRCTK